MTSIANRDLFIRMLTALGAKDFETFEACLAEDILLEWPFPVMESFPLERRGARWFREMLEISWRDFDPYAYRIEAIHDMAAGDMLIAEYSSRSRYLPTGAPYSNRYVSIVEFSGGLISRWREYLNPQVIAQVLGTGAQWNGEPGPVSGEKI
ncbi:nuclear transport factor 2 family protein [Sphingobium sp. EM0848]|uniref:nuclear transport factor 2 family protein n=1 Tax=Sphingobium sp. EM0848 TaxID=2743473 RepID=UPI00159C5219|nr:nuclear transport factor 2 family protein [Sphingobium sp. EM0848]